MDKIEVLHERFKKLSTVELCNLLVMLDALPKANPKLLEIIKTYIARSIAAEGIS